MNRLRRIAMLSSLLSLKVLHTFSEEQCLFPFPALVKTFSSCHKEMDEQMLCDVNPILEETRDHCIFKKMEGCLPEFMKMSRLMAYDGEVQAGISMVAECEQICLSKPTCLGFDFTLNKQCHLHLDPIEFSDTYVQNGIDHYVRQPCTTKDHTDGNLEDPSICLTKCDDDEQPGIQSCTLSRTYMIHDGKTCTGESVSTLACWKPACPVHGQWSEWSVWGQCSSTCGSGKQGRIRSCSKPTPRNSGDPCDGSVNESKTCQLQVCPTIDGGWADWSDWSTCSETCGDGTSTRTRQCTLPLPSHDGATCTGRSTEWKTCMLLHCFGLPVPECGPNCWRCDVISKQCEQDGCALGFERAANGSCEPEALALEDGEEPATPIFSTIENTLWIAFAFMAIVLVLLCIGLVYGLIRKRRINRMPPTTAPRETSARVSVVLPTAQ